MEVTAQQELRRLANFFLEFSQQLPVKAWVKGIAVIAVGCSYKMCHAVLRGKLTHFNCHIKRARSIVNARQRMGVNINHIWDWGVLV
jgi:hypothetical protein